MTKPHLKRAGVTLAAGLAAALVTACADEDALPIKVELGTRSVSKLPFIIAADQGLYEKYGLDVDLRMPKPPYEGGIDTDASLVGKLWRRMRSVGGDPPEWQPDVFVDGLTPAIVKHVDRTREPHRIAIAGIDCVLRAHIVGSHELQQLSDLKGKRLGISARRDTTTGFGALMLAKRMGWDPVQDISIKLHGRDVEALEKGLVDAIVASETRYSVAKQRGFPILADTHDWGIAVAGNSVLVESGWLDEPQQREAALRFLRATVEGLALFHRDKELALDVMARWNGVTDREIAETIYARGLLLEQVPYPCYDGIENTFDTYPSNELRRFTPEDFYDDSLIRELDDGGFIAEFFP